MKRVHRWPIFICYRRVDGAATARRLHDLLTGFRTTAPDGSEIETDPYLDENMPGVADWRSLHRPYLEKARALIVICTPGARINEGEGDWVHREIDWWIAHRKQAPILVDPLMEGSRYVPDQIALHWPDIQRIVMLQSEWSSITGAALEQKIAALRRAVLGAILPSGAAIYQEELDHERGRAAELERARDEERSASKKTRRAFRVAIGLLAGAVIASGAALYSADRARRNERISTARRIDAEAGQQFQLLRQLVAQRAAAQDRRIDLVQQLEQLRGAGAAVTVAHGNEQEGALVIDALVTPPVAEGAMSSVVEHDAIALPPEEHALRQSNLADEIAQERAEIQRLSKQASFARERGARLSDEGGRLWAELARRGGGAMQTRLRPVLPEVFSVEILSAGHGESILIHYGPIDTPRLVLINSGPRSRYAQGLKARLRDLSLRRYDGGAVPLELLAIGDQDEDKSGGLLNLLADIQASGGEPPVRIERIWANIFGWQGGERGPFRNEIRALIRTLGISHGIDGARFVVRPAQGQLVQQLAGGMKVVVLGPTREALEELHRMTARTAQQMGGMIEPFDVMSFGPPSTRFAWPERAQPAEQVQSQGCRPSASAKKLAGGSLADRSVPNLASSVLLFEYGGRTFLHTGDSRSDLILDDLASAGLLDDDGHAHVDMMNIPHGGSARNVTPEFFSAVRASSYLITGDGRYNNPDIAVLAALIAARPCEPFRLLMTTRDYGRSPVSRKGNDDVPATMDAFFAAEERNRPAYRREFLSARRGSIFVHLLEHIL